MIIKGAKNLCRHIDTNSPGSISMTTRLKQIRIFHPTSDYGLLSDVNAWLESAQLGIFSRSAVDKELIPMILADAAASNANHTHMMASLIVDDDKGTRGCAVFDNLTCSTSPHLHYALALVGKTTQKADGQFRERSEAQQTSPKVHQYWVLLLEPKDLQARTFIRVGIGKVYCQEYWPDAPIQQVTVQWQPEIPSGSSGCKRTVWESGIIPRVQFD